MSGDIFESVGFHPVIEQWFQKRYAAPSPPQADGWPSIVTGNHTRILASTGSGKTPAAFLWSIDQLFRKSLATNDQAFDRNSSGVHTLYISPLKALSNDIHQNLKTPFKEIQRHTIETRLKTGGCGADDWQRR
jgi:ATP-dependent Lhr-like helicase